MQQFAVGQRWVSASELQLGVGMVVEVEFRTVHIIFPASGETRVYAKQSAPLSRVQFVEGDRISDQENNELLVEAVEEKDGLLTYLCRNELNDKVSLREGQLNNFLKLNHPLQRLLNGQIDRNKWFELRARTQKISSVLGQSSLQGLTGCRTSLIDHQLFIAHEVANRYAPRVLLADEVGLGKTIEAGLIIHQQLLSERAARVLIVVPESLLHQWLVEMMRRFNLLFSVFDEHRCQGMEATENDIDTDTVLNPFHSEQLVLCSLEFLAGNPQRFEQSLEGEWDVLVVDEAHHLVWQEEKPSLEYRLIERLAGIVPSVLLLTATPEQLGKESHFARLRLLDPDRFSDLEHFIEDEQHYQLVADIVETLLENHDLSVEQVGELNKTLDEGDNRFQIEHINDPDAAIARQAREQLVEHLLDRHGTGRVLFRNTRHAIAGFPERQLHQYLLECPEIYRDLFNELGQLTDTREIQLCLSPELILQTMGDEPALWTTLDPRVNWLVNFLREDLQRKVLVICSRASTALALVDSIRQKSGLNVAAFHEGLNLVERDRAAAWFADNETGAQALICSEIGSEGRNFQFAHHLVMFDLPSNPDLLEQRIGRLDRIGQSSTIHIHTPFLRGTAQETMLNWLHAGLNAFLDTCPAGHRVYREMQDELMAVISSHDREQSELIEQTKELHQQLNAEMQQGRDRLLEYNSCRPAEALQLRERAEELQARMDISRYMESLFDCYGVSCEMHSPGCWVLKPTDHMLNKIPGLPDDGMTITYDRAIALANEDVRFFTWEHPLVRTMMDMLQSSELGNTSLLAVKYPGLAPGTLMLDCFFRIDVSDIGRAEVRRHLSDTLIRICLDEKGRQYQQTLSEDVINRVQQLVDMDTSIKVVRAREANIKQLLQMAEEKSSKKMPAMLQTAREQATDHLQNEINRLQALQTINPNVRDEEIEFFKDLLTIVIEQLDQASIRLDAVRVLVAL